MTTADNDDEQLQEEQEKLERILIELCGAFGRVIKSY